MAVGGCLIVLLALAARLAEPPCAEVEVASADLRIADVFDLSGLPAPLAAAAGPAPLGRLSAPETRLSGAELAARARAAVPALAPWTEAVPTAEIVLRRRDVAGPASPGAVASLACARLTRALRAGDTVLAADLAEAPCGEAPASRLLTYDPVQRATAAARDLEAGRVVVRPSPAALADLPSGQTLQLEVRVGHVSVAREVETLQAARRGEDLFVRTSDGEVLRAPYPTEPDR